MERLGLSESDIRKAAPGIWEGTSKKGLKKIAEYTVEYKSHVEEDIAAASIDYIRAHAKRRDPFFLQIGWTQTHYPNVTTDKFTGKSPIGPYGDALLQHDFCVGQVLDAIERAGIEGNTIVIYLSDNGATPVSGPSESRGGSNGMYTGELGDGREGSIRTPGIIKWPGEIPARRSNGMVGIHDFFPTLASIIKAKLPKDRPIDGIDQSEFFFGKQKSSNREAFLTFIGNEVVAVRWREFRIYPQPFMSTPGNPSSPGLGGVRLEGNSMPAIYDIQRNPREDNNILAVAGWILPHYLQVVGAYMKSLEKHPNPAPVNVTHFKK